MTPEFGAISASTLAVTSNLVAEATTLPSVEVIGIVGVILIVFKFLADQSKAHREERALDRADREKDRELYAAVIEAIREDAQETAALRRAIEQLNT